MLHIASGDRLQGAVPPDDSRLPKDTSFVRYIEGQIASSEQRATEAVRLMTGTIGTELLCHVCGLGGLARAAGGAR